MPLKFHGGEPFVEPMSQAVCWHGNDGRRTVVCKATRLAIDALYQATELTEDDRRVIFNRHRAIFEAVASKKFDANQTTEQGAVVVEANDIAEHHGRYGEYRAPMPGKFV